MISIWFSVLVSTDPFRRTRGVIAEGRARAGVGARSGECRVYPPRLYELVGWPYTDGVSVDGAGGVRRISVRWSALILRLAWIRLRWRPATLAKVSISYVSHKGESELVLRILVKSDPRPQMNWKAISRGGEDYGVVFHEVTPFLESGGLGEY